MSSPNMFANPVEDISNDVAAAADSSSPPFLPEQNSQKSIPTLKSVITDLSVLNFYSSVLGSFLENSLNVTKNSGKDPRKQYFSQKIVYASRVPSTGNDGKVAELLEKSSTANIMADLEMLTKIVSKEKEQFNLSIMDIVKTVVLSVSDKKEEEFKWGSQKTFINESNAPIYLKELLTKHSDILAFTDEFFSLLNTFHDDIMLKSYRDGALEYLNLNALMENPMMNNLWARCVGLQVSIAHLNQMNLSNTRAHNDNHSRIFRKYQNELTKLIHMCGHDSKYFKTYSTVNTSP